MEVTSAEFVCFDCTCGRHKDCDMTRGMVIPVCRCTDSEHALKARLLVTVVPEKNALRLEVSGIALGVTTVTPAGLLDEYIIKPGDTYTLNFDKGTT